MKENSISKSLRWVANQIPCDTALSEEDKMLLCIKCYSLQGAEEIDSLSEKLSSWRTD